MIATLDTSARALKGGLCAYTICTKITCVDPHGTYFSSILMMLEV